MHKADENHPCSGLLLQNVKLIGENEDHDEIDNTRVSHDAEGKPTFCENLELSNLSNYLSPNKVDVARLKLVKWFHEFYGPKPAQFKEYLL